MTLTRKSSLGFRNAGLSHQNGSRGISINASFGWRIFISTLALQHDLEVQMFARYISVTLVSKCVVLEKPCSYRFAAGCY